MAFTSLLFAQLPTNYHWPDLMFLYVTCFASPLLCLRSFLFYRMYPPKHPVCFEVLDFDINFGFLFTVQYVTTDKCSAIANITHTHTPPFCPYTPQCSANSFLSYSLLPLLFFLATFLFYFSLYFLYLHNSKTPTLVEMIRWGPQDSNFNLIWIDSISLWFFMMLRFYVFHYEFFLWSPIPPHHVLSIRGIMCCTKKRSRRTVIRTKTATCL